MSDYCPKCGYKHSIKSGKVEGQQRWKCKSCSYQYTRMEQRGRPLWQKSLSLFLYCHGVPLYKLARLFGVQPSTILKWVRHHAGGRYIRPEASSVVAIMEKEEMRAYMQGAHYASEKNNGELWIAIESEFLEGKMGITISDHKK